MKKLIAVVVLGALGTVVALTPGVLASASAKSYLGALVGVDAPLVERDVCYGDEPVEPTPQSTSANQTVVSVTVAQSTLIRVGVNGEIEAVTTNTGCTPKSTNSFAIESGGTFAPASEELKALVLSKTFHGDWTQPGTWNEVS